MGGEGTSEKKKGREQTTNRPNFCEKGQFLSIVREYGFLKLLCIWGNLGQMNVQVSKHAHKRPEKTTNFQPWLVFRLRTSRKHKLDRVGKSLARL